MSRAVEKSPAAGRATGLADRAVDLVASGTAVSRTELAAALGVAPSTASSVVASLMSSGLLSEAGATRSTGGRPRRILSAVSTHDFALAVDLGSRHARFGVVLPGGHVEDVTEIAFDLAAGPRRGLDRVARRLQALAGARRTDGLRGVAVSLPGPVDVVAGTVDSPSRMPGWDAFPVREWLAERLAVAVTVDNDANLMALAEHAHSGAAGRSSITVKCGTAIGAGLVVDGQLYRGATGAAGDITHVRVDAAGREPCSCGNVGCLETVASGAALVRLVRDKGVDVSTVSELVTLVRRAEPVATRAVRRAGHHLGEVLAANVNFFNPTAVHLGGQLSTLEPFVASVRSTLYERCHPLMTRSLLIAPCRLGADASLIGAGLVALQQPRSGRRSEAVDRAG